MIEIPYNFKEMERNSKRYGNISDSCLICNQPIDTSKPHYVVDVDMIDGIDVIVPAGEGHNQPIGADCLRKHPELNPYVVKKCLTRKE